ncbi:MAG: hypothetical protein ACHQT8_03645 [Chlamydiales bacterium]
MRNLFLMFVMAMTVVGGALFANDQETPEVATPAAETAQVSETEKVEKTTASSSEEAAPVPA